MLATIASFSLKLNESLDKITPDLMGLFCLFGGGLT